jgi:ADP-ribose pyrophosphatase
MGSNNDNRETVERTIMDYEEKTVSVKHIYKGNIIDVDLVTVTLPDGRTTTRDIVRHPGASVIIPLNEKGEIYMVKQYRKPLEAVSLEIPAGKLDPGEDPLDCARRELMEETGLKARNIIYLTSIHSTPGFSDEVLHMYVAVGLVEGKSCADADEFISTEKHKVEDLSDMILSGKITDAKSIIGILMAERIISGKIQINYL